MQIFSFCMADFSTQFCPVLSMDYGAPEEIRTPDLQIRSLVLYPVELRRFPQSASHQSTAAPSSRKGLSLCR
jgi:hypothetical protein